MSTFTPSPPSTDSSSISADGGDFVVGAKELCGLRHDLQVVEFTLRRTSDEVLVLESKDGRLFLGQRSRQRPDVVFIRLGLEPFESLRLAPSKNGALDLGASACRVERGDRILIENGLFSLEVALGVDFSIRSGFVTSGPIRKFRIGQGEWRGGAFIDSRREVISSHGEILEEGPIRVVYHYRVEFGGCGFYEATVTVDAGQTFAKVEEEFSAGSGDQLVWDFSGADLPVELYVLDSSASYETRPLAYHFDSRLARLAAWTQQSQHLDFVDGFAIQFLQNDEVAGFITLAGGSWRGAKLNHIEAWVRRWLPGDPASRRDVPADAKADSYPGPDRVPARGGVLCEEHFQAEAWLGNGRRSFALMLTTRDKIQPLDPNPVDPLGHFEDVPDRARYAQQQSYLRKIHTQYGVMPLQEILAHHYAWPDETASHESEFRYPHEVIEVHFKVPSATPRAAQEMVEYIEARVFGFWEGSGIAYSNPVVSRRVAPEMFRFEWLVRNGGLSESEQNLLRARFAFLMYLFASENFYTGDATMLPAESPDTTEPTLAGMANQNFYTDVFNVIGAGAQIFHQHPMAKVWRERFLQRWDQQLAFHMYPESGLWEESHTYYLHVLSTVLPTLLRRRADGVGDEFSNPLMQRLVGSALKQMTPRDIAMGDRRYLIAFGDHSAAPQPALFSALAVAFEQANPELARHLAWAAKEMGASGAGSVTPIAPSWVSEFVQGLGVVFRGYDAAGVESLLAFRSGAAWGHHHNDDGSIQFFAKGRALIVDSALGNAQSGGGKVEAKGHSRWSLRDASPVNYYWRFNRGWIADYKLDGRFPFAKAYSPVFMVRSGVFDKEVLRHPICHWRTVVQLDALTYLVVDTSRSSMPQVVRFHLVGANVVQSGTGVSLGFSQGILTIAPILEEIDPRLLVTLPSKDVSETSVTTEVAYEIGEASFSAFLIHVGKASIEMASLPSGCIVRSDAGEFQISRPQPDLLAITDICSGELTNINIF